MPRKLKFLAEASDKKVAMRPLNFMSFQRLSPLWRGILLCLGVCLPFGPLNALESSFFESQVKNWSRTLNRTPLVSSPTKNASCGGERPARSPAGEPSLQTCTDDDVRIGRIIGRVAFKKISETEHQLDCISTAETEKKPDKKYRYYQTRSSGMFSVYNEFDPTVGYNSKSNETRTYFIYPIRNPVLFGENRVQLPSGHLIHFSEETGDITQIEGCDYALDTQITNPSNRSRSSIPGGLQIEQCEDSIVIDSGTRIGDLSYLLMNRNSAVRDPTGRSCQISNSKLFRETFLINSDTGKPFLSEVLPRYQNSSELAEILSKNCPDLDLSPLR